MALLAEAKRRKAAIPIVMITGAGSVSDAVQAMRAGAFDFVLKPVDPEHLLRLVARALEHQRMQAQLLGLSASVESLRRTEQLVGRSPAMQRLRAELLRAAQTDRTVLVRGPVGSGKQLVAREIHFASSRSREALVFADGTSDALLPMLRQAEGGSLVLQEVGELSAENQAVLLRLLEHGQIVSEGGGLRSIQLRVIATTRSDLAARTRSGAFRPELQHLVEALVLDVPPLSARLEDLPELCEHWMGSEPNAARLGREALEELAAHEWTGNLDELRNVLERAYLATGGQAPDVYVVREALRPMPSLRTESSTARAPEARVDVEAHARLVEFNLRRNVDQRERELVIGALARTAGVKKDACDLLGIDPRNLGYYLRKHKIRDAEWQRR